MPWSNSNNSYNSNSSNYRRRSTNNNNNRSVPNPVNFNNNTNRNTNYNENNTIENSMMRSIKGKRVREVEMLSRVLTKKQLSQGVLMDGITLPYASHAAMRGHTDMTKVLMKRMNKEKSSSDYKTPLYIAVENGDRKMIEMISKTGKANPKITIGDNKLTIMHAVVTMVSRYSTNRATLAAMNTPNAVMSNENYNLRLTRMHRTEAIVKKLFSMGVKPDQKAADFNGTRPLQLLFQTKLSPWFMKEIAEMIMSKGFKVDATLKRLDLDRPLNPRATGRREENFGYIHILVKSFLHHKMTTRIDMEHFDSLVYKLHHYLSAKLDARTSLGNTPLMMAAEQGNNEMIRILIRNGASFQGTLKNKDGKTAADLYAASAMKTCRLPNPDVLQLLQPISLIAKPVKTYNRSFRLQNNMNTMDPISLNTVNPSNAYVITKDIRNVTRKNKNGRNERVKLIQRMYNKSSIEGMLRSRRSLVSPVTRQPFTTGNVVKLTEIVHPDEIKRFRNLNNA